MAGASHATAGLQVQAAVGTQVCVGAWRLVFEALLALGLLLFMVWWVMFAGRRKGERDDEPPPR